MGTSSRKGVWEVFQFSMVVPWPAANPWHDGRMDIIWHSSLSLRDVSECVHRALTVPDFQGQ